jgi:hypothetical protein
MIVSHMLSFGFGMRGGLNSKCFLLERLDFTESSYISPKSL